MAGCPPLPRRPSAPARCPPRHLPPPARHRRAPGSPFARARCRPGDRAGRRPSGIRPRCRRAAAGRWPLQFGRRCGASPACGRWTRSSTWRDSSPARARPAAAHAGKPRRAACAERSASACVLRGRSARPCRGPACRRIAAFAAQPVAGPGAGNARGTRAHLDEIRVRCSPMPPRPVAAEAAPTGLATIDASARPRGPGSAGPPAVGPAGELWIPSRARWPARAKACGRTLPAAGARRQRGGDAPGLRATGRARREASPASWPC